MIVGLATACGGATATATAPAAHGERLEIVEGTPVTLADGTVVEVKRIGYMHVEDDRDLSRCILVLHRGSAHAELPLAREHGGRDPESSGGALGWEFSLEVADPYRRPPRVVILAAPQHANR